MPSKYSAYKGKFPKQQIEPTDGNSEKIQKALRQLIDSGVDRRFVLKQFKELRLERDALKERTTDNGIELKARELWLLEFMEDEQITQLKDDEGFSFSDNPEPYASIRDHSEFEPWAEKEGVKELYTLNHQTLNKVVKDRILNNQPIPPGVDVFMKNKIRMLKPR